VTAPSIVPRSRRVPMWLKIAWTMFLAALVPIYWSWYGPGNFLWFSDIALFLTLVALWREWSLPASVAAVSVLLLETVWVADFVLRLISGVDVIGVARYMFDDALPLYLRAISLFHVVLPILLLWLLHRLGYDRRALILQTVLAWIVLPLSWLLTGPEDNVNWVYGFDRPQAWMPPLAWVGLMMVGLPAAVYLPTHLLVMRAFSEVCRKSQIAP
jgi:hypothetical protein